MRVCMYVCMYVCTCMCCVCVCVCAAGRPRATNGRMRVSGHARLADAFSTVWRTRSVDDSRLSCCSRCGIGQAVGRSVGRSVDWSVGRSPSYLASFLARSLVRSFVRSFVPSLARWRGNRQLRKGSVVLSSHRSSRDAAPSERSPSQGPN